jgi:hypothetical protein
MWTLPNTTFPQLDTGTPAYVAATTISEIREQYEILRKNIEVYDWQAITELRTNWYVFTHGVANSRIVATGEMVQGESLTMFPVGEDGILGEVQVGHVGVARENRWPEAPTTAGEVPVPRKRLEALALHDAYLRALRTQDIDGIAATMRPDVAMAIRSYLDDESATVTTAGLGELRRYYAQLFERFHVRDVQLVNRVAESWYVFAELHWTVEYRAGERAGAVAEFCTAATTPIDPEGRFWVQTGQGTDPVTLG